VLSIACCLVLMLALQTWLRFVVWLVIREIYFPFGRRLAR